MHEVSSRQSGFPLRMNSMVRVPHGEPLLQVLPIKLRAHIVQCSISQLLLCFRTDCISKISFRRCRTFTVLHSRECSTLISKMKFQIAAAVCLVLLVTSEMAVTSQAASCNIYNLLPCLAASKNAKVFPSRQCCNNVASMGKGLTGAKCLCSLLSNSLAKSQGVVPRIALGIPHKCGIAVPRGFVCQGIRVPGS